MAQESDCRIALVTSLRLLSQQLVLRNGSRYIVNV